VSIVTRKRFPPPPPGDDSLVFWAAEVSSCVTKSEAVRTSVGTLIADFVTKSKRPPLNTLL
jgi:hypothetical protein